MQRFFGMRVMPRPTLDAQYVQRQQCGEHLAKLADNQRLPRRERNRLADEAMKYMTTKPPK